MNHAGNYIMNASCLFDGCGTDIAGMVGAWGKTQVIYVARRQTKYGQPLETAARIFISGGSVCEYADKELPFDTDYVQDTGMGHKYEGYGLLIENVIEVVDGEVVSSRNDIGLDERRRGWTFKQFLTVLHNWVTIT